jgi:hypothetical protein
VHLLARSIRRRWFPRDVRKKTKRLISAQPACVTRQSLYSTNQVSVALEWSLTLRSRHDRSCSAVPVTYRTATVLFCRHVDPRQLLKHKPDPSRCVVVRCIMNDCKLYVQPRPCTLIPTYRTVLRWRSGCKVGRPKPTYRRCAMPVALDAYEIFVEWPWVMDFQIFMGRI